MSTFSASVSSFVPRSSLPIASVREFVPRGLGVSLGPVFPSRDSTLENENTDSLVSYQEESSEDQYAYPYQENDVHHEEDGVTETLKRFVPPEHSFRYRYTGADYVPDANVPSV